MRIIRRPRLEAARLKLIVAAASIRVNTVYGKEKWTKVDESRRLPISLSISDAL